MSIPAWVLRAQDGVVKDTLQTVSIARLARKTQQVAGQLKVRIGPAGCLKMSMGYRQALAELPLLGSTKSSFGPQPPEANCCVFSIISQAFRIASRYLGSPRTR